MCGTLSQFVVNTFCSYKVASYSSHKENEEREETASELEGEQTIERRWGEEREREEGGRHTNTQTNDTRGKEKGGGGQIHKRCVCVCV